MAFDSGPFGWQGSRPKSPRREGSRSVSKADLGAKQLCPNCQAKFYDLNRRPAHCPKCDTEFDPEEALRLRNRRGRPADVPEPEEAEDDTDDQVKDKKAAADDDEEEDDTPPTPEIDQEGHEKILTPDDDDDEDTSKDDAGMNDDDDDVLDDDDDDDSAAFIDDGDDDDDDFDGEIVKPSKDDD